MAAKKPRNPKRKTGDDLARTLRRIAGTFGPADVDRAAADRYRQRGNVDHADVARLHRSGRPDRKQTARLRAAAMLAALDHKDTQ